MNIQVNISKNAMNLLKSGEATIGPGGICQRDGKLVELLKLVSPNSTQSIPAITPYIPSGDKLTIALQAVQLVAQVTNCVFSYKNGKKLNKIIRMLSSLKGIVWANTAIGAANMALTAMSFSVINSKLDGISQQITFVNVNENLSQVLTNI